MTASASVVEALKEAVQLVADLSGELGEEIKARYDGMLPQMQARFDRDMSTVDHAEASLPSFLAALNAPHPAGQDAREAVARIVEDAAREGIRNYCLDRTDFTAAPFVRRILALTQAAPDGWRPIETAPKDGTWVVALKLGHLRSGEPIAPQTCRWDGAEWEDSNGHDLEGYEPDLWMPLLPAPPAQGAGG